MTITTTNQQTDYRIWQAAWEKLKYAEGTERRALLMLTQAANTAQSKGCVATAQQLAVAAQLDENETLSVAEWLQSRLYWRQESVKYSPESQVPQQDETGIYRIKLGRGDFQMPTTATIPDNCDYLPILEAAVADAIFKHKKVTILSTGDWEIQCIANSKTCLTGKFHAERDRDSLWVEIIDD